MFELLTLLRSRRFAITATQLAEHMEVSERTIYRDIQSLISSGVPIQGEAGVGYLLQPDSHLPPLMFTEKEMMALELGMRMVRAWSDDELARASQSASNKILSVLPDRIKRQVEDFAILVPDLHSGSSTAKRCKMLRHATDDKLKIVITYLDQKQQVSERMVQPLGQIFWGKVWTLVAWCELRHDYRHFRIDRIEHMLVTEQTFETHAKKSLEHYIKLKAPER
nr:YafY family protein [Vibrio sp. JPW-9-11-11]